MKDDKKRYVWIYAGVVFVGFIILGAVFLYQFVKPTEHRISCDIEINNIEYVNLSKNTQCFGSFSKEYCPMPHDIKFDCELAGGLSQFEIINMLDSAMRGD